MNISRREILLGSATIFALTPKWALASDTNAKLIALEEKYGGRLGVAALNTSNSAQIIHRAKERFGLCSTFKFLAAAAILQRVDQGNEQLHRHISYTKADLLDYAPITKQYVDQGSMTLGDLCAAAVELSDNTAGNLLLRTLGGPKGLTQFMRSIGDNISRLDRTEPTLNIIKPGDPRDTTTPEAMLKMMKTILINDTLSASSRQQIETWMRDGKTGSNRLAAGLPSDWQIGDKTGTGLNGEANDIAIIWPPARAPILVACFYVGPNNSPEERNTVHAEVGRIVARQI